MANPQNSKPRKQATTVDARQGDRHKENLRVLIQSMVILTVVCLVAAAVWYGF